MESTNLINYEYDDFEQAKIARDTIKDLIETYGGVLKQRNYYQYLVEYYKLLNKDVGEQDFCD